MIRRKTCPACDSVSFQRPCWTIPFSRLDQSIVINGATIKHFPCLSANPDLVCKYVRCHACDCVYLSPVPEQQGHTGDHYVRKMRTNSQWTGYYRRYEWFAPLIPEDATVMIDAACGVGQYLRVARQKADRDWQRLIGLEYNQTYVDEINSLEGFEARQADLNDPTQPLELVMQADVIVFSEAFEHMQSAWATVRLLASMLRPGGLLFFSAQAMDGNLPVRPDETIYVTRKSISCICDDNALTVEKDDLRSGRYWIAAIKAAW